MTRRLARLAGLLAHLLAGVLLGHTLLPLLQRRHNIAAAAALVRWWHRRLLRVLAVRVEISGRPHSGPVLLVANHISWLDIPCLAAATDTGFVSKAEVGRWPLIGALAHRTGTVFLARGAADAGTHAAGHMTWALQAGRRLVVFPEGTTTDGRSVRPFHARLYQAAIRTHSPVQAVALRYPHPDGTHPAAPFIGDDDLLHHLWKLLGAESITARIEFCSPLATGGRERRALARATRDQVCNALALPAIGTPMLSAEQA
jgi:1-acyl-sn-glycerol-3-phosphate acyltransferase